MNKNELEEVFHIKKEIDDLDKRISRLRKQSIMVGDVVQNGYKRHAHIYGEDIKRTYKLHGLENKFDKYQIMLINKQNEIEEYIEVIPFSEIRQIFRLRYLDNKNWVQISHEMNSLYKSREYTEDSVRHKHDRYLEKNK